MNYVSTCPACSTRFTVRLEQLAEQAGQVKCGQCQTVYNALPNLLQINDEAAVAAESYEYTAQTPVDAPSLDIAPTEQALPEDVDNPAEVIAEQADDIQAAESAADNPLPSEDLAPEPELVPDSELSVELDSASALADISPESPETAENPIEAEVPIAEVSAPIDAPIVEPSPVTEAVVAEVAVAQATVADVVLAKPIAHFVQPTESAAKPVKKYVRPLQYAAMVALIFLSVTQSVYFMRSSLAQSYPALKPSLLAMCQSLHCNIELAKNLSLLEIEDSDLHEDKEHTGVLRFSSSLLNRAGFAQAYPNIELTLTDDNEIALLRRTIKPQEYADKDSPFAQGIAAGEGLRIDLALTAADARVSGYRVLLTY
jgi:predicted Zn finger-like uncharacterized protein